MAYLSGSGPPETSGSFLFLVFNMLDGCLRWTIGEIKEILEILMRFNEILT